MVMRHRLRDDESGITLIEMIVVLMVIAILVTVAVSSFLGARERAGRSAAQANVRAIVPALHAYRDDYGTYAGMSIDGLKALYDLKIDSSRYSLGDPSNLTDSTYCVQSTVGAETFRKAGPNADIVVGVCP
jgi:prepilin-type N-terminal cleavage/methylation domain-containing protein